MNAKLDKSVDGKPVRYVMDAFSDGTSWFRTWSDGWLEQGGVYDTGSYVQSRHTNVSFLLPFANSSYTALCCKNDDTDQSNHRSVDITVHSKTVTSMDVEYYSAAAQTRYFGWQASGRGA